MGVTVIHVPSSPATDSLPWQLFVQLCRFAVPCFFMLSGYFFMRSWNSTEAKRSLLVRYALRLMVPFAFWAFFYAIVPPFVSGDSQGIALALKEHLVGIFRYPHSFLLTGGVYHLWFFSSLLQALLILWVCLCYGNLTLALVIGSILYGLALLGGPYAVLPIGFHTHFDMKMGPFFSTVFVALGALISKKAYTLRAVSAILVACLGALFCLTEFEILHVHYGQPSTSLNFYVSTLAFAPGVIFLALSWNNAPPMLAQMGTYALGVYAIHVYVVEALIRTWIGHAFLFVPLAFACVTFGISLLLVTGLAKLRFARPFVT